MTRYDVVDTPVGPCVVAVDGGRVRSVRFGRRPGIAARMARLPQARRWIRDFFAGREGGRVPVDLGPASTFDRAVYGVVRRIPPGRTMTYGDVARRIGRPGAARAVGQALRRNPVCLFIPCHRVVGAAGPGGFSGRGGVALKRRLLALEARASPAGRGVCGAAADLPAARPGAAGRSRNYAT